MQTLDSAFPLIDERGNIVYDFLPCSFRETVEKHIGLMCGQPSFVCELNVAENLRLVHLEKVENCFLIVLEPLRFLHHLHDVPFQEKWEDDGGRVKQKQNDEDVCKLVWLGIDTYYTVADAPYAKAYYGRYRHIGDNGHSHQGCIENAVSQYVIGYLLVAGKAEIEHLARQVGQCSHEYHV